MPAFNAAQLPEVINQHTEELRSVPLVTHNGQQLSPKEDKFISLYIKLADAAQAAQQAGYSIRATIKNPDLAYKKRGQELLAKDYIQDEIRYRAQEFRNAEIADTNEILRYLTGVMRGEIKDQFGLDAPLGERTNAAKELAKRIIDVQDKDNDDKFVTIKLDWNREAPLEGEFTVVDDSK
jgi:phage terminase small subunit